MPKTVRNLLATAPILLKGHMHTDSESKLFRLDINNIEDESVGLLNKPQIDCIYLDMDGVLVDHYAQLAVNVGIHPLEFKNKLHNFQSKEERENYVYPLIIEGVGLDTFIKAPPTPEFKEFCALINHWSNLNINVEILSSAMSENCLNQEIIRQKQIWLDTHGLQLLPQNFPLGSKVKQEYAKPKCVLIDDFERNIIQWKEKVPTAIGIHHTCMSTTRKELKKYGLL